MATHNESPAVEDYLEKILELITTKGYARVADIAEGLAISPASVSNMMQRLDEKGLLIYEKYRGMTLTPEGEEMATRIARRHAILSEFLELLGVEEEVAYRDVEGMEHHMSTQTVQGIEQLVALLKENADLLAELKKDS